MSNMSGSIGPMAPIPAQNDRRFVRDEYADAGRLAGRMSFWAARTGPQPPEIARERILAAAPRRVLEVGCGTGELAAWLVGEGIEAEAVDQSPAMVELTAARGVRARVGDIESLPFGDDTFDVAVANYMLYHVVDLDRGLAELARVLRPGGSLVATTNGARQLVELWDLVGRDRAATTASFRSENGAALLRAHFPHVTSIEIEERFTVTAAAIVAYIAHTRFAALAENLPELPDGLVVTGHGTVFVATAG